MVTPPTQFSTFAYFYTPQKVIPSWHILESSFLNIFIVGIQNWIYCTKMNPNLMFWDPGGEGGARVLEEAPEDPKRDLKRTPKGPPRHPKRGGRRGRRRKKKNQEEGGGVDALFSMRFLTSSLYIQTPDQPLLRPLYYFSRFFQPARTFKTPQQPTFHNSSLNL